MRWFRKKKELVTKTITRDRLMECLNVTDDNQVIEGVLAVLRGLQEQEGEMGGSAKLTEGERAFIDGRYAAYADAQEKLLEQIKIAQQRAQGTEKKQRAWSREQRDEE
jgi:hypothetical protein